MQQPVMKVFFFLNFIITNAKLENGTRCLVNV